MKTKRGVPMLSMVSTSRPMCDSTVTSPIGETPTFQPPSTAVGELNWFSTGFTQVCRVTAVTVPVAPVTGPGS